ncbi:MAG: FAD-binding oxidoreductase [Jatrophihabitantaceae bacterium]
MTMHPYRWGDPTHVVPLPAAANAALTALGVHTPPAPVPPGQAAVPDSILPNAARTELENAVGAEHVTSDHDARVAHTRGWSTPDLLKLRAGDASDAPDAVVFPASADEIVRVLAICTEHRIAAVPFAGGTSVVGGLVATRAGFAGVIAVDVRRLDKLTALDAESRTATLQAGVRGTAAEHMLNERGYTLGHFPQSYEGASIGGYAAARSAGQSSAGYGRFDEMVVGLVLATPRGLITMGTAQRSAAGPDLRQLVLGSEGTLGVITEVTVRIHPTPDVRVFDGWRFADFQAGAAALRRLVQDGPMPTVLRLSDEMETAVNLADPTGTGESGQSTPSGCLAIAGYEGTAADTENRRAIASAVLTEAGGENLGTEPGEAWRVGRYQAPYLRDPLLDAGALVETLETVTFWSNLAALRAAVTTALTDALTAQGTPALVLCHISHVYEAGASLYFTVLCAQAADPLAQWASAKAAANAAIRAAGASITHHHGVGTDHRASYQQEIGPLALEVLRAAKASLDPAGILNPGVLLG